jgi:repressor LexA
MQQYGLTKKQLKMFNYIKGYIAKKTLSPSYDEMKKAVGLVSKNSVHTYIKSLEERGWIKRMPGKARSIQIVKFR